MADFTKENTPIYGWTDKLGLACVDKFKIGLLGGSFFVGWVLSLLCIGKLADNYGRKWVFRASMCATLALYVSVYFCNDVDVMIAILLGLGMATSGRCSIGYLYMVEFVEIKH